MGICSYAENSSLKMSTPSSSTVSGGSGNILLDEDRSSSSPSLPSLAGLPLRIRSASLPALIELCIMCFGTNISLIITE